MDPRSSLRASRIQCGDDKARRFSYIGRLDQRFIAVFILRDRIKSKIKSMSKIKSISKRIENGKAFRL